MIHANASRHAGVQAALATKEDVFSHREMREQGRFLGHVTDSALLRWTIYFPRRRKKRPAVDLDFSRGDISQTGDGIEQRRLAGARRPEDGRHSRVEGDADIQLEIL